MSNKKTYLIDIGNSNIQYIEKKKFTMSHLYKIETSLVTAEIIKNQFKSSRNIISSVVPKIDHHFNFSKDNIFITHQNIPKLTMALKNNEEVGADRIVSALAASHYYGGPCLIVDSGTAITFCLVDGEGCYQGGLIFPGMNIASKALNENTAKIPHILVAPHEFTVGKSTQEAVEIGLYQGYINLINGMILKFKKEFSSIKVIGTGQGLEVLKDKLYLDHFDSFLIFKGLKICDDFFNKDS